MEHRSRLWNRGSRTQGHPPSGCRISSQQLHNSAPHEPSADCGQSWFRCVAPHTHPQTAADGKADSAPDSCVSLPLHSIPLRSRARPRCIARTLAAPASFRSSSRILGDRAGDDTRLRSPAFRVSTSCNQGCSASALIMARAAGTFVRRDGVGGPAKFYGARSCAPVNLALLPSTATQHILCVRFATNSLRSLSPPGPLCGELSSHNMALCVVGRPSLSHSLLSPPSRPVVAAPAPVSPASLTPSRRTSLP